MHNAQLVVQVQHRIHQLFEHNSRLVLFQKAVLFGVLEQVALSAYLSDNAQIGLGLVLFVEFNYVGMVALLEDAHLSLEDLLLGH